MRTTRKQFDRLVEEAIDSLPEEFAQWIDEVPIIVEDAPPESAEDEEIVGFYQGHSLLGRMENSGSLPPRIVLYRLPLMDCCKSMEHLAEEIRKTLVHELGHHAGMDEEQLEELGYGPVEGEEDSIEWDVDEDDSKNP